MTRDGAAPARTQLAWSRTLLAGTVVAVLAFRLALHTGLTVQAGVTAAAAVLGWLTLLAVARPRLRALRRQPPPPARREPVLLALLVLGLAVLAIALAVLP